jgi:putative DNA primase/helicase
MSGAEHPPLSKEDDRLAAILARGGNLGIGDKVRYDHARQQWHVWDDVTGIWRPDLTRKIRKMIHDQAGEYMKDASPAEGKILLTLLNDNKKTSVLASMMWMDGISMKGDEWDPDPNLLGCANGIVDLRTGELLTGRPDLLVTKSTGIRYDPEAAPPKVFAKFLRDITSGDADVADYILRVLGYSLYGHQKEQKFWVMVGQGQNGKGTLNLLMIHLLGDYGIFISPAMYMRTKNGTAASHQARVDLMELVGKRFAATSEPVKGEFNDELIKAHTGEDPIRARGIFQNHEIQFMPTHTLFLATNNPPRLEDVGKSMQRRLRAIHFLEQFEGPRKDKFLLEKMKAESEGILRLLVMSAMRWQTDELPEPEKVLEWSSAYINENDPLSEWVYDCCVLDPRATEGAKLLADSFNDWANRNAADTMSAQGFGQAISRRFRKTKTRTGWVYLGLRLKNAVEWAATAGDGEE